MKSQLQQLERPNLREKQTQDLHLDKFLKDSVMAQMRISGKNSNRASSIAQSRVDAKRNSVLSNLSRDKLVSRTLVKRNEMSELQASTLNILNVVRKKQQRAQGGAADDIIASGVSFDKDLFGSHDFTQENQQPHYSSQMFVMPSVDATENSQDTATALQGKLIERSNSVPKSYQKLFGDLSGLIHGRAQKQMNHNHGSQVDIGIMRTAIELEAGTGNNLVDSQHASRFVWRPSNQVEMEEASGIFGSSEHVKSGLQRLVSIDNNAQFSSRLGIQNATISSKGDDEQADPFLGGSEGEELAQQQQSTMMPATSQRNHFASTHELADMSLEIDRALKSVIEKAGQIDRNNRLQQLMRQKQMMKNRQLLDSQALSLEPPARGRGRNDTMKQAFRTLEFDKYGKPFIKKTEQVSVQKVKSKRGVDNDGTRSSKKQLLKNAQIAKNDNTRQSQLVELPDTKEQLMKRMYESHSRQLQNTQSSHSHYINITDQNGRNNLWQTQGSTYSWSVFLKNSQQILQPNEEKLDNKKLEQILLSNDAKLRQLLLSKQKRAVVLSTSTNGSITGRIDETSREKSKSLSSATGQPQSSAKKSMSKTVHNKLSLQKEDSLAGDMKQSKANDSIMSSISEVTSAVPMISMLQHPTHMTSAIASRRQNQQGQNERTLAYNGSMQDPLSNTLPLRTVKGEVTATNSTVVKLQEVDSTDHMRSNARYLNDLRDDQIYTGAHSFSQYQREDVPPLRQLKTFDDQTRQQQSSERVTNNADHMRTYMMSGDKVDSTMRLKDTDCKQDSSKRPGSNSIVVQNQNMQKAADVSTEGFNHGSTPDGYKYSMRHASATESEDLDMNDSNKKVIVREYGKEVAISVSNRDIPQQKSTVVANKARGKNDSMIRSERTKLANERGSGSSDRDDGAGSDESYLNKAARETPEVMLTLDDQQKAHEAAKVYAPVKPVVGIQLSARRSDLSKGSQLSSQNPLQPLARYDEGKHDSSFDEATSRPMNQDIDIDKVSNLNKRFRESGLLEPLKEEEEEKRRNDALKAENNQLRSSKERRILELEKLRKKDELKVEKEVKQDGHSAQDGKSPSTKGLSKKTSKDFVQALHTGFSFKKQSIILTNTISEELNNIQNGQADVGTTTEEGDGDDSIEASAINLMSTPNNRFEQGPSPMQISFEDQKAQSKMLRLMPTQLVGEKATGVGVTGHTLPIQVALSKEHKKIFRLKKSEQQQNNEDLETTLKSRGLQFKEQEAPSSHQIKDSTSGGLLNIKKKFLSQLNEKQQESNLKSVSYSAYLSGNKASIKQSLMGRGAQLNGSSAIISSLPGFGSVQSKSAANYKTANAVASHSPTAQLKAMFSEKLTSGQTGRTMLPSLTSTIKSNQYPAVFAIENSAGRMQRNHAKASRTMGVMQGRQKMSDEPEDSFTNRDYKLSPSRQANLAQQNVARRMSMKSRLTMADIASNLVTKETVEKYQQLDLYKVQKGFLQKQAETSQHMTQFKNQSNKHKGYWQSAQVNETQSKQSSRKSKTIQATSSGQTTSRRVPPKKEIPQLDGLIQKKTIRQETVDQIRKAVMNQNKSIIGETQKQILRFTIEASLKHVNSRDQMNKSRSSTKLFSILKQEPSRSSKEGEEEVVIQRGRSRNLVPQQFRMSKTNASFGAIGQETGLIQIRSVEKSIESLGANGNNTYGHGSMLAEINEKQARVRSHMLNTFSSLGRRMQMQSSYPTLTNAMNIANEVDIQAMHDLNSQIEAEDIHGNGIFSAQVIPSQEQSETATVARQINTDVSQSLDHPIPRRDGRVSAIGGWPGTGSHKHQNHSQASSRAPSDLVPASFGGVGSRMISRLQHNSNNPNRSATPHSTGLTPTKSNGRISLEATLKENLTKVQEQQKNLKKKQQDYQRLNKLRMNRDLERSEAQKKEMLMAAVQSFTPDLVLDYEQMHKSTTAQKMANSTAKGGVTPQLQSEVRQSLTKSNKNNLPSIKATPVPVTEEPQLMVTNSRVQRQSSLESKGGNKMTSEFSSSIQMLTAAAMIERQRSLQERNKPRISITNFDRRLHGHTIKTDPNMVVQQKLDRVVDYDDIREKSEQKLNDSQVTFEFNVMTLEGRMGGNKSGFNLGHGHTSFNRAQGTKTFVAMPRKVNTIYQQKQVPGQFYSDFSNEANQMNQVEQSSWNETGDGSEQTSLQKIFTSALVQEGGADSIGVQDQQSNQELIRSESLRSDQNMLIKHNMDVATITITSDQNADLKTAGLK